MKNLDINMLLFFTILTVLMSCSTNCANQKPSLYNLTAFDSKGQKIFLEQFRGKVTLVVNVATYCGFTRDHYPALVKLQDILGSKKFSVLAFPCNQFGEQEPDSDEEIEEFVKQMYKVNFPLFSKIDVVGKNAHSVYKNLKAQSGKEPKWNFWKYLVDHHGYVINAWGPGVSVEDIFDDVKSAVEKAEQSTDPPKKGNVEL
ncbi:glutathione peroxidase 7-like [Tachypleus tridentatus]|uniref:glutathione peroxidase 7-like n=1 Tax=Tachypleus tridentatus TaxID=6853 RepID=UPI003FD384BF